MALFQKKKFSHKGQAALEFLTTYGWAFLILGVAIGGLSYLGVFNPSNFVKTSCQFDTGIGCPAFNFKNTSSSFVLETQLQNNLGDKITILNASIANANSGDKCSSSSAELISGGTPILASYGDRQRRDIKFTFDDGSCDFLGNYINSKQRYVLKLYYKKGDSRMPTVAEGQLIARIEQD